MNEIAEPVKVKRAEKSKIKNRQPKKYHVIFLNDNITPIEFVVSLLEMIFGYDQQTACKIAMKVDVEGRAIVGTYYFEIAEQKTIECLYAAKKERFPFQVKYEESK